MDNLVTPVRVDQLKKLLTKSGYDSKKSQFLIEGFSKGFDLGYRGPKLVKKRAPNLKFVIGNETVLWNKVMKEVKQLRYAGPFADIPFDHYIQSPIGLVPKDGGKKTRLIFHLSYPRDTGESVNENTPKELTVVKYKEFEQAIRMCLKLGVNCMAAKSDLTSAFRHICLAKWCWKFLVMKARNPADGKFYYFFDKCLPFGAAISCAIFQAFSDALSHIVAFQTQQENLNYLDDFFFVALLKAACDLQVKEFINICNTINFPYSEEKTFWGSNLITFLGLLIDTKRQLICVPVEKVYKGRYLIQKMLAAKKNKTTVRELQELTGFLNFLCKAIIPGRVFTRRLYAHVHSAMNPGHHVYINKEMKADLNMWLTFFNHGTAFCRPFFHLDDSVTSITLDWYTDASSTRGCGGYCQQSWFLHEWDPVFLEKCQPSINYLELFAVAVGVINWLNRFANKNIEIFCDNMSVVHMINNTSSKCKNCMVLLRIITLRGLIHNVKVTARHVVGERNIFADHLSRLRYREFWQLARKQGKKFDNRCTPMPKAIWPPQKIWIKQPKTKGKMGKAIRHS